MNSCVPKIKLSTGDELPAQAIYRHAYAQPDDTVFVAGTLIEGIGNRFSDVDVYVVCARRPRVRDIQVANHLRVLTVDREIVDESRVTQQADDEVMLIHAETEFGGIKIDVEFKTYDEITTLASKINDVFRYAKNHLLLLTIGLSEREKMFLHRLRFCRVLQNEEKYRQLCSQISYARYNYLLYRWLASDYSVYLDIVGAASKEEWLRAIELARSNALQQTLAYLNLIGVSNFDPKWLLTYLDIAVTAGYFDSELEKQCHGFYCYEGVDLARPATLRRYVENTLDYVDTLFDKSREHIVRNPLLFNLGRSLQLIFNTHQKKDGLYSMLERSYRGKAYGFTAAPSRFFLQAFLQNGG